MYSINLCCKWMTASLLLAAAAAWGADAAPAAVPPASAPAAAVPMAVSASAPSAAASAPDAAASAASLDSRIQDAKGDVIRLNRDLLVLEEELLFPANTQVAVFLSMDVG